jgi:hypothetical protein
MRATPSITPSPTSAAPSHRSTAFGEVSGGALGLAAATAERVGAVVAAGEATATGLVVALAGTVRVGAAVAAPVAVGVALVGAAVAAGVVVAVGAGAGVAVTAPSGAHAFVSGVSTTAHTDRPVCTQLVPSLALRESDISRNG